MTGRRPNTLPTTPQPVEARSTTTSGSPTRRMLICPYYRDVTATSLMKILIACHTGRHGPPRFRTRNQRLGTAFFGLDQRDAGLRGHGQPRPHAGAEAYGSWRGDTQGHVAFVHPDLIIHRVAEIARALDHAGEDVVPGWGGAVSRHEDDLVRADGDGDRRAGLEPGDCDAQSQSAPLNDSGLDRHAIHEVGLADELGDEPRPRPLEEILRSPDLDDAASVEDGDAVRDHHGLPLVVSDVKGRDGEGRVKSSNLEAHFFAKVCIEVAQRLVEEEDLRLHHQRPSHRDPLLLAAGEFPRIARLVAAELDDPQHVLDARLALGLRHARLAPHA